MPYLMTRAHGTCVPILPGWAAWRAAAFRINRPQVGPIEPVGASAAGTLAESGLASAHDRLRPVGHTQLAEDDRDVVTHGLAGQRKPLGDLAVVPARRDQFEHLPLARGE